VRGRLRSGSQSPQIRPVRDDDRLALHAVGRQDRDLRLGDDRTVMNVRTDPVRDRERTAGDVICPEFAGSRAPRKIGDRPRDAAQRLTVRIVDDRNDEAFEPESTAYPRWMSRWITSASSRPTS